MKTPQLSENALLKVVRGQGSGVRKQIPSELYNASLNEMELIKQKSFSAP